MLCSGFANESECAGDNVIVPLNRRRFAVQLVIAKSQHSERKLIQLAPRQVHAFRRKTPRNSSLFLRRRYAYVYFLNGSSFMLNVTSVVRGVGGGAFLHILEPLEGIDMMQRSREATRLIDLASAPGRSPKRCGRSQDRTGYGLSGNSFGVGLEFSAAPDGSRGSWC